MIELLLATNNPGKIIELQSLLSHLDLQVFTPADLGLDLEIKESGSNYRENAILKAESFARESKFWSLADDTGLEVDLLNGAPGLYSARYASRKDASDSDRRALLLKNLAGKPRPWKAAFHCVVALCCPGGSAVTRAGFCPGEIIPEERGEAGFGYDPVFLVAETGSTMAELTLAQKNALSHRGRAVKGLIPALQELLATGRILELEDAGSTSTSSGMDG